MLCSLGGIHIAGDVQIVIIAADFIAADNAGKLRNAHAGCNCVRNPLDV